MLPLAVDDSVLVDLILVNSNVCQLHGRGLRLLAVVNHMYLLTIDVQIRSMFMNHLLFLRCEMSVYVFCLFSNGLLVFFFIDS